MKYKENQHFSHHHVLNPLSLQQGDDEINCDACEEDITVEPFHGCTKCEYFLHDSCLNTPRSLVHPSHPSHPLTLHPTPTGFSRSFICDGCGSDGNGFSLGCAHCDFDIHIQCANLPASVLTKHHPHHELKLVFGSPYSNKNTVFECDVCSATLNLHQWLYFCADCDFGSHLGCVKDQRRPNAKPRKGKGKSGKPEAEKRAAGSSQAQQPQPQRHYSPSVDDINAINKAEEKIYAAAARHRIQAQGRLAALDLI